MNRVMAVCDLGLGTAVQRCNKQGLHPEQVGEVLLTAGGLGVPGGGEHDRSVTYFGDSKTVPG